MVYLTKKTYIRNLNKKEYNVLKYSCCLLNDLRNFIIREFDVLWKNNEAKLFFNYQNVIRFSKENYEHYNMIQTHIANSTIKKVIESIKGFYSLFKLKKEGKYTRPVNRPKQHKNRLQNIIIPAQSITSSKKKIKQGYIELPLSKTYKKEQQKVTRPKIPIPKDIINEKLIQVEIKPIQNGKTFQAIYTYEKKEEPFRP